MNKKITLPSFLILIYLFWFVTPVFRYGLSGIFNYLFLGSCLAGIGLKVLIDRGHRLYYTPILYPVLFFCLCLYLFSSIQWGTAKESLRVLLTYWIPLIAFIQLEKDEQYSIKTLTKVLVFSIILTSITTYLNLLTDSSVSRSLTSADTDEAMSLSLKLKNCGNIYMMQGLVLFVPILMNNIKKKIRPHLSFWLIIFIGIILLSASFTTSLLVFILTIIVTGIFNSDMGEATRMFWIIFISALIIWGFSPFLEWMEEWMPNEYIKERLAKLIKFNDGYDGNWSRFEHYKLSWETFTENWAGVGPYYFADGVGIGHHSQILDDMARYGIFAIVFYVVFFINYYKWLKDKWKLINSEKIVFPYVLAMIMFLFLNPGLRGNFESVITLFIIPGLPLVIADSKAYAKIKPKDEPTTEQTGEA